MPSVENHCHIQTVCKVNFDSHILHSVLGCRTASRSRQSLWHCVQRMNMKHHVPIMSDLMFNVLRFFSFLSFSSSCSFLSTGNKCPPLVYRKFAPVSLSSPPMLMILVLHFESKTLSDSLSFTEARQHNILVQSLSP